MSAAKGMMLSMEIQSITFDEKRKRALKILEDWLIELEHEKNNESNLGEETYEKT